jgi:peptidase E
MKCSAGGIKPPGRGYHAKNAHGDQNMPVPQIIAMGGGGFSMEEGESALDRYILEQTGKQTPRVCFIPTASGDADSYIVRFYTAFSRRPCHPTHLKLFGRTPDLREFLLKQDILYVGGGNTRSMLAVWREWGLPELLREAWKSGVVLAGLSAGAICWFQQGVTDSWAGKLRPLDCLGFLEGSCCPHYDSEPERRPAYAGMVGGREILPGYALDDLAALHFHDGKLYEAVTAHPDAHAYRLDPDGGVGEPAHIPSKALLNR